jgi:cobaltochelatase CobS
MTQQIDSALNQLETQIGEKAQQGTPYDWTKITPEIRRNLISWVTIKGVWNIGTKTSNESLAKMYGVPRYLESVLRNQSQNSSGKTRYEPKLKSKIDFDNPEPDNFKTTPEYLRNHILPAEEIEVDFDNDFHNQPDLPNENFNSLDQSKIKSLVESIVKDTIFRSINKEISLQRELQKQDNEKLKDGIIKTVHESVNSVLQKALIANREDAIETANKAVENKTQSLKAFVEDIIFQSFLKKRANETIETITENSPQESRENNKTNSEFIPPIDLNYHFDTYATKVIRSALSMHENLFVYGDTGCGKTTHLEQVCAVLNHGIVRVNPHDGITREMFLGGMKLINNETIFVEGALPIAMRNGYVFLVDEISFLPPNLTAILNPIGEKGGKLYIPETSEWITPQPGFCIFATDNTGGKGDRTGNYTGTEVQNTATLDRFAFCLKMDYLPQDKEEEMLTKRFPNLQDTDEIQKMLTFAREIRSAFSRGELSITLSTRKLIKFFDQRSNNFTIEEALSNTILSWLDEDDETLVKTMIDRLDLVSLPQHIKSYNQKIDLDNFVLYVRDGEKVNAIRELRRIFVQVHKTDFGLKVAKDLMESYSDGLITIQKVEKKIISGVF